MSTTRVTNASDGVGQISANGDAQRTVDVAIVGSGFSGLGTRFASSRRARGDYVVLERGEDVGGTWEFNTYPDVPATSRRTSTRFRLRSNPDWSRTYSRQPEIREYLRRAPIASAFAPRFASAAS